MWLVVFRPQEETPMSDHRESPPRAPKGSPADPWTEDKNIAMKARRPELEAEARGDGSRADQEHEPADDNRRHEKSSPDTGQAAPSDASPPRRTTSLTRTWFRIPKTSRTAEFTYCFFQAAAGRSSMSRVRDVRTEQHGEGLDEGAMWPRPSRSRRLTAAEKTNGSSGGEATSLGLRPTSSLRF